MANLFMRFPGGVGKCLTLSYDDGVCNDRRLIKLMQDKGLRGTFNINSGEYADRDYDDFTTTHRRLTREAALELYGSTDFEIATHAVTHPFLEQLPAAACTYEILRDRRSIEMDYGRLVRGFAYPFGTFSDEVVNSLRACGIVYGRTVWSSHSFDVPKNEREWLLLKPTCHHGDERLPELTERFVNEQPGSAPWFFYLWGHSYEFDFNNNWNIIETFADRVGGRDDIWYATNIEAYDYIAAYRSLIFNADMTLVKNPSATDLWFEYDRKTVCVKAGETLKL